MDCALCRAVSDKDRCVFEGRYSFAVVCKWPLKPGHTIVIPKRHVVTFDTLNNREAYSLLNLVEHVKQAINRTYEDSAIVFQNSGTHATQEHLHLHVLPSRGALRGLIARYEGVSERAETSPEQMREYARILRGNFE